MSNANGYATSGTKDVGSINKPDSSVTFTVDVPRAGRYRLGILYGNQTGDISQQVLRVDGGKPQFIAYPATLNWVYRARKDVDLSLTAGTHQITLATSDPALGTAKGEVTLDRIDLTATSNRPPVHRYPAVRADIAGRSQYDYNPSRVRLRPSAHATFAVYAPGDGYYDVSVRYAAAAGASLTLGGSTIKNAELEPTGGRERTTTRRLFLAAGINRIGVHATRRVGSRVWRSHRAGESTVSLDSLAVAGAATGLRPIQPIEAEDALLAGTARVVQNAHASGGAHVERAGNGSGNTVTLTGPRATRPGQYVLAIREPSRPAQRRCRDRRPRLRPVAHQAFLYQRRVHELTIPRRGTDGWLRPPT